MTYACIHHTSLCCVLTNDFQAKHQLIVKGEAQDKANKWNLVNLEKDFSFSVGKEAQKDKPTTDTSNVQDLTVVAKLTLIDEKDLAA